MKNENNKWRVSMRRKSNISIVSQNKGKMYKDQSFHFPIFARVAGVSTAYSLLKIDGQNPIAHLQCELVSDTWQLLPKMYSVIHTDSSSCEMGISALKMAFISFEHSTINLEVYGMYILSRKLAFLSFKD